ncbi:uncharacterized protein LOC121726304 [Aricia agestis]|uniref:uncharacterized protein LOC121726304 n=1 Tax=Aricia agestis TaxID=91739 RepID=UPI001C2024F6|nr:uncharacterized protein LOC121726304 [Aricia agestis]
MAKWTEDITYKFVQEYLKYECLYNCKSAGYKNKRARDAALLCISEAMNIPGFGSKEVYTKIRNLKSTYSQEVKKVRLSTKSGAGRDAIYNPRIKWFKLFDDALKAVKVQCSDSGGNVMQLDSCEILDEDESYTSQPDPLAEKNKPDPDATPEFEDEERNSPIPRKRTARETINTRMPTETETEFDIFGKSVAAHLKSLPIHKAIEGQMFIQNYLCNLRLEEMGHGTSNYTYSPSPNFKYKSSPSPTNTLPPRHSPYTKPQEESP